MPVFPERLLICVRASFPFGFNGGMWDLIVLVPDHCLCFFFFFFFFFYFYLLIEEFKPSKSSIVSKCLTDCTS